MASKKLFSNKTNNKSNSVKATKPTNTTNEAGGQAYSLSDKAALAQYAMTGCFNGTYYASDQDQLNKTLELAKKVPTEFLAKLAVYARQKGMMKDAPAVLAAVLAGRDSELLSKIFSRAIDNPKMIRNFVQIIRSGVTGRKSLGTRPKKLVQAYLEGLTDEQLFKSDVGNNPSLPDIIKMVHPRPANKQRNAMFAYLLNKEYNKRDLNKLVKQFEAFKKDMAGEIPDVPFQMLTALPLTDEHWKTIASNATWTQTRMNLATFMRHGVFNDSSLVQLVASKLEDKELIKKARVFPYQIFTAFQNTQDIPTRVSIALQKAADIACENIPDFGGKVYVLLDTSGSMSSPVTGNRGSVTTKTRCIDVAALFASAIMKRNVDAEVIPFDTRVHTAKLNPLDSISTNAQILAKFGGGGTDCGIAMAELNKRNAKSKLVVMISDNESWSSGNRSYRHGTSLANEWQKFKVRNPGSKLVNIDIQPYPTTQINSQKDVINLGGFSDTSFEVIAKFVELGNDADLWFKTIEDIEI